MNVTRETIIKDLGVSATISAKYEIASRVKFLKNYLLHSGAKGFVLGISGGQDSSLAGKLCQISVEELRKDGKDAKFFAIRLPHHRQIDELDAQNALEFIKPDELIYFNIGNPTDSVANEYLNATGTQISDFNKGNVKARLRMIAQYAIAGGNGLLVVGTDHAAEAVTGFFTKFGDGGADILPLAGLTKRQGKQMLIELGAKPEIYNKVPTADLLDNQPGQTDEENLGISYEEIDDFLEGISISQEVENKLISRYVQTAHKRNAPITRSDFWLEKGND